MMAALNPTYMIFDMFLFLYAMPLKRLNRHRLHLDTTVPSSTATYMLWSLHTAGLVQRLASLLYQMLTTKVSEFLVFHFIIAFQAVMGYLCAGSFFLRANETQIYFKYLQYLLQRSGGMCLLQIASSFC